MKAVRIHEDGGPEVLRYEDADDPVAGPGEVLIRLRAASLNHLDLWMRRGMPSAPKPRILGADGAGVVVSGHGFEPGERVVINPGLDHGDGRITVVGEAGRHANVRDHDVRPLLLDLAQEILGVIGLPDDLEALCLEQRRDALPEEHGVVRQHDPDRRLLLRRSGEVVCEAKRREVGLEPGRLELEDPFGLGQAAQAILAELAGLHVVRQEPGGCL